MAKKRKTPLSSADQQVWEDVTRSVEPLEEQERQRRPAIAAKEADEEAVGKNTPPAPRPKKRVVQDNLIQKRQTAPTPRPPASGLIDRRGQRRIAKGQMPIDSTLDLHGMTQEQAYARLSRHITAASHAGERCILVITGKGGGDGIKGGKGEGVLRRNLPDWLGNQALGPLVSAISPAARTHGGSGAYYVRLKKQK